MRVLSKLILGIVAIAVLVWLMMRIGGFTLNILGAYSGNTGEHDPMFAEEMATEIPVLPVDEEDGKVYQDNSANWDTSVQTPVDRTAEELGEEARIENEGQ